MKIFLFSDEQPTADDHDFIEAMLGMLNSIPKKPNKADRLYSDDVLKLARELDLSVESTIEVMKWRK